MLVVPCRAPLLKSLHLVKCFVSNKGFAKAIEMLPPLEDLRISQCTQLLETEAVKLVARACPLMKHLRVVRFGIYALSYYGDWEAFPDGVAFAVARMNKLVSSHLVGLYVGDLDDLTAILDN
jgi:hypothetical protein